MADESHSFASTRARLEDIVTQVRKKDTSLEKSLDLLEEGVRLANACTELIDHQDWVSGPGSAPTDESAPVPVPSEPSAETESVSGVSVEAIDGVVFVDGEVVAEVFEVSAFTGGVDADGEAPGEDESEAETGDPEVRDPEAGDSESAEDEVSADAPADADAPEGGSEEEE